MKTVRVNFRIEVRDNTITLIKDDHDIILEFDECYLLAHWLKEYLRE